MTASSLRSVAAKEADESWAAALSYTCTVLQLAAGKYHVGTVLLQPQQLQAEALLNTCCCTTVRDKAFYYAVFCC